MNIREWRNAASAAYERAKTLSAIDPSALTRRDLGKDLSFEGFEDDFIRVRDTAVRLEKAIWDDVPGSTVHDALTAMDLLVSLLDRVVNLSAVQYATERKDLPQERGNLVQQLQNRFPQFFAAAGNVLSYASATQLERAQNTASEEMKEALRTIAESATAASADVAQAALARKALDDILATARQSIEREAVDRKSYHFENQAKDHRVAGFKWLAATVVVAAGTVAFGIANYKVATSAIAPDSATTVHLDGAATAQLITAKLILFSLLASATVWCGRIYRAHRHNEVVNRHRANALTSFQAFVQSATDEQTKNAVLLEATRSIFAPQPTGYSSSEAESGGSPQLIEILRTLPGAQK